MRSTSLFPLGHRTASTRSNVTSGFRNGTINGTGATVTGAGYINISKWKGDFISTNAGLSRIGRGAADYGTRSLPEGRDAATGAAGILGCWWCEKLLPRCLCLLFTVAMGGIYSHLLDMID